MDPDPGLVPVRRLGANLGALAASQAVTWVMSLLWTLIVPRLVGPAGMGMLVTATSATAVISILLSFGAKDFLVRGIVAEPEGGPSLVGTALLLRLCLAPVYVGAVAIYARFAHFGSQETQVLYLIGAATLSALLIEPLQAIFQATQRMQYLALGDVFNKTAVSAAGVALALVGFGVVAISVSTLVISGMGVALFAYWLWSKARYPIKLGATLHTMGRFVARSLPYWAFGVFYMIYLWIDSVILALMARPEVVGWYGAPTRLFTTLMFAPAIIATAWLPRLVTAFKESPGRFRADARTPIELVLVLSLPVAVVAAMTAHQVIPLIFGAQYGPAVPVMVLLALCVPPMYLGIMLNQVLIAQNRPLVWTWLMGGATVVNPILNVVLIRYFQRHVHNGAEGAAFALLVTEVLILVVGMLLVGRRVLDRSSLRRFIRAAGAAVGMTGVMYLLQGFGFVVATVAGGATFVGLAVLLRVTTPEERVLLRVAIADVRARRLSRRQDRSGTR